MKDLRLTGITAAAVMAVLGVGTVIGMIVADDQASVDALFEQAQTSARRAASLEIDLRRTQAERNRLDAQLAAEDAPAVCPNPYLSSGEGVLYPTLIIDYPCGWHVARNASARVPHPAIDGVTGEVTWISRLPLLLGPSGGLIGDIEMTDWSGTGGDDDPLPSFGDWLDAERESFAEPPDEDRFEGAQDRTIHRLRGTIVLDDDRVAVEILVWSYIDPLTGVRHIVRTIADQPGRLVREALDRLARSFTVPAR